LHFFGHENDMTKKALPVVRKNYKLINVLEGKENEVEIEVIGERKEEEPEKNIPTKDKEKNNESNESGKKRKNLGVSKGIKKVKPRNPAMKKKEQRKKQVKNQNPTNKKPK
jgi:hypothetical protein